MQKNGSRLSSYLSFLFVTDRKRLERLITMTDEKLGALLGAFANFYWSVPVDYVLNKIAEWYPEADAGQLGRVLKKCNDSLFWYHCSIVTDGVEEPELAVEHLTALGGDDYDRFIAGRIDAPFYECDEKTLLRAD